MASYINEAAFYSKYAADLIQKGINIARPFLVEASASDDGVTSCDVSFLMSDLRVDFPRACHSLSEGEMRTVLTWLARFHGTFWEQRVLAPQGGYWYLSTRLDEFDEIPRSAPWNRLSAAAPALEAYLRGDVESGGEGGADTPNKGRTVVHGDTKSANILFNSDASECALYDFQYVGQGVGSLDLAYLFVSSADGRVVRKASTVESLLRHYHDELVQTSGDETFTFEALQQQYELAVCDYSRFMAGWGWWGNDSYAQGVARSVLDRLDGGSKLTTEEYAEALRREFPLA